MADLKSDGASPSSRPIANAPNWDTAQLSLDGDVTAGEAVFRSMADNFPMLCWTANGDGYITWYNKRWHDYCGSTPEEMEGWGWQSVHDPLKLPEVMAGWVESIATGSPFEMTFPLKAANGTFRSFLTRVAPVRSGDGKIVRWFGTNTDVTDQLRAEAALDASEAKYTVLTEAMPQMVWSTLPDGFHDFYNAQWYEFTGVPEGSTDGEAWNGMFHPDDQDRAWARWRHSLETGEPYEIEYRLRHRSGEYRWTLGRAQPVRDEGGQITRWIGTCTDINDAKLAAARNEILTRELSHRIKNIFAIVTALVRLSARRQPAASDFAKDLLERIAALGRAHEFARPHSDESRPTVDDASLKGLLRELFTPYETDGSRIVISGADVPVDDKGATPLALLFHELATNAAKYGSLTTDGGTVRIDIAGEDDEITIEWREQGGPALSGVPDRQGFGTSLAAMSVEGQMGGTIARDWRDDGLHVKVQLSRSRLAR